MGNSARGGESDRRRRRARRRGRRCGTSLSSLRSRAKHCRLDNAPFAPLSRSARLLTIDMTTNTRINNAKGHQLPQPAVEHSSDYSTLPGFTDFFFEPLSFDFGFRPRRFDLILPRSLRTLPSTSRRSGDNPLDRPTPELLPGSARPRSSIPRPSDLEEFATTRSLRS